MSCSKRPGAVTIFVVDDDAAMRDIVAATLTAEGYWVHQACDGQELLDALLAAAQRGNEVDLVVTDVAMPGMNGIAARAAARSAGLNTPFIFMTAFAGVGAREAASLAGWTVLDKPFEMNDLLVAVREQLQDRAAS